jgi:predicted phage baseplate assembly protein
MALQPIPLDTLDWDQMVTAIRTRIVPDSQGKWTLHAPVDPGVTMLELFAWLLDQRVYWMDQVPASLSLANLALLGHAPLPAQVAVTALQVADTASPPRNPPPVATAGTLMQLGAANPPLLFSLNDDLTVLPVADITISVDGIDRTDDLRQCRLVPLVAAGATSAQVEIVLGMSASLPVIAAGQFFSLMIDLETSADIYPQWTAQAASGILAPATLTWSYTDTANVVTALAAAQVGDGTGGLRRSGIVRLPLPLDWQPKPPGANSTLTAYTLVLQIQSASFTFPPQLRRLKANVVLAQHLWMRTKHPVTQQWLPLPGNVISLPDAPSDSSMAEYPPIETTVAVQIKEPDGVTRPWQAVSDLSRSGPTDRVFVVDRARSQVRFGDGLTGRLPVTSPADLSDVTVIYQAGGGNAGNVGEGLSWVGVPATDAGALPQFSAINLAAGSGGAETETIVAAIARCAADLNLRNRAVSKVDYENLAITTPGVALRRAYAAVGFHPDFPAATVPGAVTVFVVPYAPRVAIDGDWASGVYDPAPLPDAGALQAAQTYLSAAKLIGGEVFVCPPSYRQVWLTLTVAVDAPLAPSLRQALLSGLQNFLDPLIGGNDGKGWAFGDPLRPSALLGIAQRLLGTTGDMQSVAVRIDDASAAATVCTDVAIRPFDLITLVHVDFITQRRAVPSGDLR